MLVLQNFDYAIRSLELVWIFQLKGKDVIVGIFQLLSHNIIQFRDFQLQTL